MNIKTSNLEKNICVSLPAWFDAKDRPLSFPADDVEAAMRLAIELSRANVSHQTGGPFGALVVQMATGRVISAAVNCVEAQSCSSAHAEIMALSLAQKALKTWNLAAAEDMPLTLITSCEPCVMCWGAIPWSGVRRVVCGANKEDAELAGFDEGARPNSWIKDLNDRGIEVVTDVLREEAASVLRDYANSGQTIYNP